MMAIAGESHEGNGNSSAAEYLRVTNLHAFYGESHILHGMDFSVNRGELVTLLGRNGSGRTTTLKAILGLVEKRSGSVMLNGRETVHWPAYRIARLGVGYCPEERGIFASLSAEENLLLPPRLSSEGMSVEEIYSMFPQLKERRHSQGSKLSGGEQQMLAMARILRTGARLLLLDEVSEGLAPVIVQTLRKTIAELKTRGFTMILVEQNFRFAAALADRMYVVERGRIVMSVGKDELTEKQEKLEELLRV
ncbi:MAG TPA: ABC transporter ATP-binding protein [Candidatus Limnocylindrales bacterium]|nr:ABC transporter ATP-binding protein [Candidatus Limnocylindrales bacterium]